MCPSCQVNSRRTRAHQDEMHPLKVPTAFDRWHLDFLDLPTTIKNNRWLLVGVDYATNWPVARAVPVASKEAVADFIYEEIVMNFGVPSEIVTDRGANFTSELVKEYLKRVGTNHKLTSAYHPRTNAKAERFNGVIKQMLRKYTNGALHRWDDFVKAALFACRVRIHSTTGFSPFYLTYGREPRIPGDTLQPYIDANTFKDPRTVADFTARELSQLGQHRAAAEFKLKAMAEKDKQKWDATVKKLSFETGDMVMLTHEGRFGLEPRFKGPFIVVEAFHDYCTYKLQTLAGEPLKSLVHVDRLKPALGDKPTEPWYDPVKARRDYNNIMKDLPTTTLGVAHSNSNAVKTNEMELEQIQVPEDFVDPIAKNVTSNEVEMEQDALKNKMQEHSTNSVSPSIASHPSNSASGVSNMSRNDPMKSVLSQPITSDTYLPEKAQQSPSQLTSSDNRVFADRLSGPDSPSISKVSSISVPGRTQSLEGGNVEPIDSTMEEVPIEVELRLKKEAKRKRKFKPNTNTTRKKTKVHLTYLI